MKGQLTIELFFAFTLAILMLMWLNGFSGVVEKNNTAVIRAQVESVGNDLWAVSNLAVLRQQSITMPVPCIYNRDEALPISIKFEGCPPGPGTSACPKLLVKSGGVKFEKLLLFEVTGGSPDPWVVQLDFVDCASEPPLVFSGDFSDPIQSKLTVTQS
ncbi:MAG: hypothetical protein V1834_03465 [Candidatus Micrarchaeota archaeon]